MDRKTAVRSADHRPDFGKAYPASRAILLSDVAAKTGMQFDLSGENARDWIHADAIMDQTIRMEQLDCLLSHLLS